MSRQFRIIHADVMDGLRSLPDQSVHCVVTSPPYWGLRDYGVSGQIGLEPTPEAYVARLVDVFREVRRVLRDDGVLFLNLGDSYAGGGNNRGGNPSERSCKQQTNRGGYGQIATPVPFGLKPKDLVGIPWRVAFALQADGWWLRSDVIWSKPNPMPESVTDRPTKAHEYLFLLTKAERYWYDGHAIAEPAVQGEYFHGDYAKPGVLRPTASRNGRKQDQVGNRTYTGFNARWKKAFSGPVLTRNRRTVWTIATEPFPEAHFATFPTALVEPCILAGCPAGGTVLDPFAGSGTTGVVTLRHDRQFVGIELNREYAQMARRRITGDAPLLNHEAIA